MSVWSRRSSGAWIAAAWTAPLLWLALTFATDVSDGSVVSSPTAVLGDGRWGSSVTVLETYGDTPLRPGDEIQSIELTPMDEWIAGSMELAVTKGDVLDYRVRRNAAGLDLIQDLEVPVTSYPVASAVTANLHRVVLAVGLLAAGSFLVWRGARRVLALGTLAAGSATAVGLTAAPFGPQAVDLAVQRGLSRPLVGETALAVALGAVLLLVTAFPDRPPPAGGRGRAGWALLPLLAPALGYATWVVTYAAGLEEPARTQAVLDVSGPAAATAALLVLPALATSYRAATEPHHRVAVRLLVVAALASALLVAILHVAPVLFRGAPLVPWDVLAVLLVPLVLACWVVAVLDYRLVEVDALLRRSLVQLVLLTLLGALFLVGVGAVNVTSGGSVQSMVTGGVVVMILLPVAVVLRRTLRRLAYGERADPARGRVAPASPGHRHRPGGGAARDLGAAEPKPPALVRRDRGHRQRRGRAVPHRPRRAPRAADVGRPGGGRASPRPARHGGQRHARPVRPA